MSSTSTDVIDGVSTSVAIKAACKYATTGNITLSGLAVQANGPWASALTSDVDRILVRSQTTASENGIYIANSSAWVRAADFDGNRDVVQGTLVPVVSSTGDYAMYQVTTANPITIGTSSITFDVASYATLAANLADSANSDQGTSLIGDYNYQVPAYLKVQSDINFGMKISIDKFLNLTRAQISAIRASTSEVELTTYFEAAAQSGAKGIYVPYGRYIKKATTAPSNQWWDGDGIDITTIMMPQENQTLNYNFFSGGSNDLSNFMLSNMTLKGSLDYQTSAATSGLVGFALYSRGAVNNVHFIRTKITKFGDQVNYSGGGGGGGIVLGHPTTSATTGKASSNISAQYCVFDTNSNVPGFYLSQGGDGDTSNVKIIGNHFTGGYSAGSSQNCLYLLGQDATRLITDVIIHGNTFKIETTIDQAIELNWIRHAIVSGNTCHITSAVGAATSGFILLRDGCEDMVVSGNTGRDYSGLSVGGITLVRFAADAYHTGTDQQRWITIDGNTMHGFDRGVDIGSGSQYVGVTDNVLSSCGAGLYLTGCSDTEVSHNKIYNCGYAGVISGGTATIRRLKINHNESYAGTSGAWTNLVSNEDIQYLEFEDNTDSGSAGTYMLDMNTAASTGNRFINNRSSLTPLNPSHIGDFATIKLADTGPITIADGTTAPNVRSGVEYVCAATAGTTISSLTGTGYVGQVVTIRLASNWTVDFTGTTLKGNGGVDLAGTASNGIRCQWDGTNWLCEVIGA